MPPGLFLASPGPLLASPGPLLASHGLFWAYPRFPGPLLGLSGQTGVSSPTRGSSRWIHLAPERDYSGRPSSMYMWSPHDIGRESWVWEEQEALQIVQSPHKVGEEALAEWIP